jgi:phosphoglycolate phosphatase
MPVENFRKSMNDVKNIIFDFDGTIANTFDLAVKIYNNIAPEYNCTPVKEEDIEMLRMKKPQEFLKKYRISTFKLPFLLLRGRKELSKHISEIEPVKNIEASLYEIKNAGFRLGILTSNSKDNVSKFLENNNLLGIFDFIYSGKNIFGKDKVIRRLLRDKNISKESVIYVGDETRDVEAAKKAEIPVVAVSWGFNSREILVALQPNQIADDPDELLSCLQRILNGHIAQHRI